jgi:hypothetical protein
MVEGKIQVGARIPKTLYDNSLLIRENMTVAIIDGLELLIKYENNDNSIIDNIHRVDDNNNTKNDNVFKANDNNYENKNEIQHQLNDNECYTIDNSLITELKTKLEEKESLILVLREDLEQAHKDKDDIKNLYDNYMRQMQTLIQQKAIKAPGEENKKWWKFW